jgi:hypothetical protein
MATNSKKVIDHARAVVMKSKIREALQGAVNALKRYRSGKELDVSMRPYGGSVVIDKPDFFDFMNEHGEALLSLIDKAGDAGNQMKQSIHRDKGEIDAT